MKRAEASGGSSGSRRVSAAKSGRSRSSAPPAARGRFPGSLWLARGRSVSGGKASGEALVCRQPISFYGGVDVRTGTVVERGHELEGQSIRDRILVFPRGKGSTVGSYVIYGLTRNGAAPGALVNEETETVVATGAILAGIPCVDGIDLAGIKTGDILEVDADRGTVRLLHRMPASAAKKPAGSRARKAERGR